MYRNDYRESSQTNTMKKQRNMFQIKEQKEFPEADLNETETSDLPDRELKMTVVTMITEMRRTFHAQSEDFNREIEKLKKDLKNTITEEFHTGVQ